MSCVGEQLIMWRQLPTLPTGLKDAMPNKPRSTGKRLTVTLDAGLVNDLRAWRVSYGGVRGADELIRRAISDALKRVIESGCHNRAGCDKKRV